MTENKQPIPKGKTFEGFVMDVIDEHYECDGGLEAASIINERYEADIDKAYQSGLSNREVMFNSLRKKLDRAEADKQVAVRDALLIYNPGIHAEEIERVLAALDHPTNGDTK